MACVLFWCCDSTRIYFSFKNRLFYTGCDFHFISSSVVRASDISHSSKTWIFLLKHLLLQQSFRSEVILRGSHALFSIVGIHELFIPITMLCLVISAQLNNTSLGQKLQIVELKSITCKLTMQSYWFCPHRFSSILLKVKTPLNMTKNVCALLKMSSKNSGHMKIQSSVAMKIKCKEGKWGSGGEEKQFARS